MSRGRCSCASRLLLGERVVQCEGDEGDDALAVETGCVRAGEPAIERTAKWQMHRARERRRRVVRDERAGTRPAVDEALSLELAVGLQDGVRIDREIEHDFTRR